VFPHRLELRPLENPWRIFRLQLLDAWRLGGEFLALMLHRCFFERVGQLAVD
jgi:hypothetical protein